MLEFRIRAVLSINRRAEPVSVMVAPLAFTTEAL